MENKKLPLNWKKGIRISHKCHARLAAYYTRVGRIIGLITTILSAIVATTVFTALTKSDNTNLLILAGLTSILAVIFSASKDFLNMDELAVRHRQAVGSFGRLRRKLEMTISFVDNEKELREALGEFNNTWSELDKKAPSIPNDLYQRIKKEVDAEKKKLDLPQEVKDLIYTVLKRVIKDKKQEDKK